MSTAIVRHISAGAPPSVSRYNPAVIADTRTRPCRFGALIGDLVEGAVLLAAAWVGRAVLAPAAFATAETHVTTPDPAVLAVGFVAVTSGVYLAVVLPPRLASIWLGDRTAPLLQKMVALARTVLWAGIRFHLGLALAAATLWLAPAWLFLPAAIALLVCFTLTDALLPAARTKPWDDSGRRLGALEAFASRAAGRDVVVRVASAVPGRAGGRAACAPFASPPQIVLSEREVERLDEDELRGVVAHEVAHIERRLPLSWLPAVGLAGAVCLALLILRRASEGPPFSVWGAFAVGPSAVLVAWTAWMLYRPLARWAERREEIAAHRRAVELTGDPDGYASALRKLADNAGPVEPPPWWAKLWYVDEPSPADALGAIGAEAREPQPARTGRITDTRSSER